MSEINNQNNKQAREHVADSGLLNRRHLLGLGLAGVPAIIHSLILHLNGLVEEDFVLNSASQPRINISRWFC